MKEGAAVISLEENYPKVVGAWLGNLAQPHPTSPQIGVYKGNCAKIALDWELRVF